MALLIAGLALWSAVHLIPSLGIGLKQSIVARFGEPMYKASFSIVVIASLVLIVFGWRNTIPQHVYLLPAFVKHLAMLLILCAFVLFTAARRPTRIKRWLRHPQLTGVLLWAIAHLLINGDSRSLLLFGWMATWAIAEMLLINRRQGIWIKSGEATLPQELIGTAISLALFVAVVFAHPYLAGVPIR